MREWVYEWMNNVMIWFIFSYIKVILIEGNKEWLEVRFVFLSGFLEYRGVSIM